MGREDMRWRKLDGDICEIKQRLSRIEGRCEVIHQNRKPDDDERPSKPVETPVKFLFTHWKFISGFLGFVVLWARSGTAANQEQVKRLSEAVAWMAANW